MRKYFIILASLAVAGCMVSEISEETVYVNVDYPTYTAAFDDESTKVYVDTDLKMHWNAGDEISIFRTTGNQRYSFDGADGDREGTFSVQGDPQGGSELQTAYAVYPYSDNTSINTDGVITLNLPEVQHYAENSFGLGANTMVAVTESKDSDKLYFKNLCGYLVVKLYGEGTIKSITLTGNNGEKLSGQATVTPVFGEAPVLTMSESAGTSITLDCGEGVALGSTAENATAFWFAVPPVTFTQGFTIEVTDGALCTTSKETSIERTIVRNVINSLQSLQIDQTANQLAIEREALIAIYNAAGGDNWENNTNWCSNKPVGEWYGVATDTKGFVTSIGFYNNHEVGYIPKEVGQLSNLTSLSFDFDDYQQDALPVELGDLKNLTSFQFIYMTYDVDSQGETICKNNQIYFPDAICDCESLTSLQLLVDGGIKNGITNSIGKLKKLNSLTIWARNVSEALPEELFELTSLRSLAVLYKNLGEVPNSISNLSGLKELTLSSPHNIPESLGDLVNLESLSIQILAKNIEVSVPASISNLSNLRDLRIYIPYSSFSIIPEIGLLTGLIHLEYHGHLTGSIPEELGNLINLKYLCLSSPFGGGLEGEIPNSVKHLDAWTYAWGDIITNNPGLTWTYPIAKAPTINAFDSFGAPISINYKANTLTLMFQMGGITSVHAEYLTGVIKNKYQEYKDRGLSVVSWTGAYTSVEETHEAIRSYVNTYCVQWPVYSSYIYKFENDSSVYPGSFLCVVLVNADGEVIYYCPFQVFYQDNDVIVGAKGLDELLLYIKNFYLSNANP